MPDDTLSPTAPTAPHPALYASPWPAEDGGPRREQAVHGGAPLAIRPGERLTVAAVRDAVATTMVLLRGPGEVFVLRHTLGRRPLTDPVTAWVEQVDPVTLAPVRRSPPLASGPFWPGGAAILADGGLVVVTGNHAHRLSPDLQPLAARRLPGPRPYNSFVVLADGTIATKDFDRDLRVPATVHLLDPDTLAPRGDAVDLGEPCIARLTADGDDLYVVGARTVIRLRHDAGRLTRDTAWGGPYLRPDGSYGWDPVVAGGHLWFLDNGAHDFVTTMRGAGVAPGPVHLHRLSLADARDREAVPVCGLPRGAVTDPPLYDPQRRIAVAYDSANGVVQAFRLADGRLTPLWRRELDHAAHMVLHPSTGELVLHDFRGPTPLTTAAGRAVGRRFTAPMRRPRLRRVMTRGSRDEVVVVDAATGTEKARAPVPSMLQSVVFPAPGFGRDLYWCTMTTLARLTVS